MIELSKISKVYLMCPPNFSSGGPELLHQLSSKLNLLGASSYMYYHPVGTPSPTHKNYFLYNTTYTDFIEDNSSNIIIIPEVMVQEANSLPGLTVIRKCIWWLSIDNFYKPVYQKLPFLQAGRISKFFEHLYFFKHVKLKNYFSHFVQSKYAFEHLSDRSVTSFFLSDYLNNTFIAEAGYVDRLRKEDIILYNPKKGFDFTKKIISEMEDYTWIPLIDLTPEDIKSLLKRAKVYIDFGNHPGKDRFPREAAILGCCVITGKRGSAKFFEDVSISEAYKIEDVEENIPEIVSTIKGCLVDYNIHIEKFESYRQKIMQEEGVFVHDINSHFQFIATNKQTS
jgi:hypothetical protein